MEPATVEVATASLSDSVEALLGNSNPCVIPEKELTREEARRIRDARFPIGRPPTVEDVAAAIAFFASEEAEYVTGQVVNVSGGWML